MRRRQVLRSSGLVSAVLAVALQGSSAYAGGSFAGGLSNITQIASTIPSNGDVNPYGIVVVPMTLGDLTAGNVLVSNFNAVSNLQGTGTTIVDISPGGARRVFARIDAAHLPGRCPGGVGLTTALSVLPGGFVVVGSLPTTDGTAATAGAGCLIVLDREGHVVETISGDHINGPWDMTEVPTPDGADLFVTNVLNGAVAANGAVVNRGTVVRISLRIERGEVPEETTRTVIGSGFAERTDPASLVIGPTGLGLAESGTLYVADSLLNRIAAIPDAVNRTDTAFSGRDVSANGALNDPLGLAVAPNGDILTVNGANGKLVETTPQGTQVDVKHLDLTGSPPGAGALFGLAVAPRGRGVYFVDDVTNTLDLLH